jgi:YHS domain-containing protein
MKAITTLLIAASLVAAAVAAPPKTPKTITCAVMTGNKVNIAEATKAKHFADVKGRRYFFCCEGCPAEFKAHTAKYLKSASIPTPKAPK